MTFCGVAVAMPQGQSWAPPSSSESQRTWEPFRSLPVSTLPAWWAGWVHRRPIGLGRGGAVAVFIAHCTEVRFPKFFAVDVVAKDTGRAVPDQHARAIRGGS